MLSDVAPMHGTQMQFPPGNRSLTRDNSTTASETEVFPIPPGPRMQTREDSSFMNNCAISSTNSSRPWKMCGLRGIRCRTTVFDDRCVSARICFISFTSLATCWVIPWIFPRRAWSSWRRSESRRSLASWRTGYHVSCPSHRNHVSRNVL